MPPTPIILDCDPGHDDAIALLLALASPEVELLGVTTTYGNQTLEKTTANALRVLELVERTDVPVAAGADRPLERELVVAAHVHGDSGLDGPVLPPPTTPLAADEAISFMAERIRGAGRPVTLVPTGPLTNVARYLDTHGPDGIERIAFMGGAIAEGNFTPAAEFNVWCDPEAAARVLASGLDVTMLGLDVTHQAILGPEVEDRLRAAGRIGTFVAELNVFFTEYHRAHLRLGRRTDPRCRRRRAGDPPRARRDAAAQRRGRARVGADTRANGRRPLEPHRASRRTRTSRSTWTRRPSSTCSSSGSRASDDAHARR